MHSNCAIAITILCAATAPRLHAQEALDVRWERSFGVEGYTEFGKKVVVAPDGGYVVCGWSAVYDGVSAHPPDGLLVKFDTQGEVVWSQYHGGEDKEYFFGLTAMGDGGYAAVGELLPIELYGPYGAYLIITNLGGSAAWERVFSDEGARVIQGDDVQHTHDGGLIVAGHTLDAGTGEGAVPCLLKTGWDGHLAWIAPCVYGASGRFAAVRQLPDGDFVAVGYTFAPDDEVPSLYLVRTDDSGRVRWRALHREAEGCAGTALAVTPEGSLVAAAAVSGDEGFILVGFGPGGSERWASVLFSGNGWRGNAVCPLGDGGYLAVGNEPAPTGSYYSRLVRTDAQGGIVWSDTIDGHFFGIAADDDGTLVLAGNTRRIPGENDNDVRLVNLAAPRVAFVRGRVNADAAIDIADAICLLDYLFGAGGSSCKARVGACLDAADVNDDGAVDIADAVAILDHLFGGAAVLPDPFSTCGHDPTPDVLQCTAFESCRFTAP